MTNVVIDKHTVRSIGGAMTTRGELTREHILKQARIEIKRKGFAATSINDLLDISGTTKGNLYFHFTDKENLGLEVLKREQQDFMFFLDSVFGFTDPLIAINMFFDGILKRNRLDKFVGGCLFGNMALESSDSMPVFSRIVNEVFREWISRLQEVIAKAQAENKVTVDISAKALAEMIVATIEGGIMQARLQKSEVPLKLVLKTLSSLLGFNKKETN